MRLLGDPVRRAAYELVVSRKRAVSRGEVADALGVSRTLAAFHLDRLAEAELLIVSQGRLGGRTGPGAGRPAKLYRQARPDLDLLIPPRRYDLAATLLADAVASVGAEAEVQRLARELGRRLAREEVASDPATGGAASTDPLLRILRNLGYAPRIAAGEIRLSNCPFHAIADQNAPVVCGMNHACLEGLVEGCGAELILSMDPGPGDCCVVLHLPARLPEF
jgi:predicted ArsR family transcriptional regulator